SGKMLAIENVEFGQRLLVDFVEAVGNELAGKLMAGSEAISEQNGILLKKWFAYVHDFERGDGKAEELGQPAGHVFIDKGAGSLDGVVFKFDDILASVAEEDQLRTGTPPGHPSNTLDGLYRHV